MTQVRKSSYPSADQFPTRLKFQARNLPFQNVPVSQIVDSVPTHWLWPQNLEIWQSTQNHTAFLLINWYNPRFLAERVKRTTRSAKEKEHRSPLEKYQPSETGLSPDRPSRRGGHPIRCRFHQRHQGDHLLWMQGQCTKYGSRTTASCSVRYFSSS